MTTKYLSKNYNVFIGIDTDKNSNVFTVKDDYIMKKSKRIPSNPENLYNYIKKNYSNKKVICAYEAGPTGFGLHDYFNEKGVPCLIASPLSIPKPPNEKVKNNRLDSIKITEHLSSGKLKPIRVPQGAYRELRYLVTTRENYARLRKVSKQRIKALLLYASLHYIIENPKANWSNSYIENLKELQCTKAVRIRLDMLLKDLEYAKNQILSIEQELKTFRKQHNDINKYIQCLESIPGIGFTTAISVLARSGNPRELKNVRELAGFTGVVPSEHSTGDNINKGSITHLGNRTLRYLLVEAAWSAIRKDTELKQFFHRIKSRHHPKIASKKAIVAVARKLTCIIYKVLKEQRMYIKH